MVQEGFILLQVGQKFFNVQLESIINQLQAKDDLQIQWLNPIFTSGKLLFEALNDWIDKSFFEPS